MTNPEEIIQKIMAMPTPTMFLAEFASMEKASTTIGKLSFATVDSLGISVPERIIVCMLPSAGVAGVIIGGTLSAAERVEVAELFKQQGSIKSIALPQGVGSHDLTFRPSSGRSQPGRLKRHPTSTPGSQNVEGAFIRGRDVAVGATISLLILACLGGFLYIALTHRGESKPTIDRSVPPQVTRPYPGSSPPRGVSKPIAVRPPEQRKTPSYPGRSQPPRVRKPIAPTPSVGQAVPPTPTPQFDVSPLPLPDNGTVQRFHVGAAAAPLSIVTRSSDDSHYYVKLTDWYDKKRTVLTVFVRAGQRVNIKVPLGSYELRYAAGKTWYGEKHLFGPKTGYKRADKRFDFRRTGNRITGYTIELFLQVSGNLATEMIGARDF